MTNGIDKNKSRRKPASRAKISGEKRLENGRTTVVLSASVDPAVKAKALENAAKRGHRKSLSAYITWLIEQDQPPDPKGTWLTPEQQEIRSEAERIVMEKRRKTV